MSLSLRQSVAGWLKDVRPADCAAAFDEMIQAFGTVAVIGELAKQHWRLDSAFCEKFIGACAFAHRPRPTGKKLTIALYYSRIANGGVEKVCVLLCNSFAEQKNEYGDDKYNVIMVTDNKPLPDEYLLSPEVKRAYVPPLGKAVKKQRYVERCKAWRAIIEEYDVDIVMHAQWLADESFWDMLTIKSAPSHPAFITHCHGFCAVPYMASGNTVSWLPAKYQLCDGAVTLSECDREFVRAFNSNAHSIVNPFAFSPREIPNSGYEPNTLVWVGRLSSEKNPVDVLKVLELIRKEVPDVVLYIVGAHKEKYRKQMVRYIVNHDLGTNVHMVGFTLDTAKYYRKASVFLMTSSFEGFSLSLAEALSFGVPTVMYDIPYITMCRDGRGIVTVPQRDCETMAREVVKLLRDPVRVRELGAQGKQMVTELAESPIIAAWEDLFKTVSLSDGLPQCPPSDSAALLYKYITLYSQMARDKFTGRVLIDRVLNWLPQKVKESRWRHCLHRLWSKVTKPVVKLPN